MAKQLEATTRELATLRVSYAKLQAERTTSAAAAENTTKLAELQQQLTATRQEFSQLQEENARIRRDLDASRNENASLAEQLKSAVGETRQSQATVAQLNDDLRAQRTARTEAEQAAAALRTQLDAVVARANRASPAATVEPAATAEPSPNSLAALQLTKAPPSGAAELHINLTHYRNPANAQPQSVALIATVPTATTSTSHGAETLSPPPTESPAAPTAAPAAAPPMQAYTVQAGDTLEKIAARVYGAADQWGKIYAANTELLSANQGLKPGMQLQIPAP